MTLPSVDPARIDEALTLFDQEERASPKWQGWETRESYKYAIAKNGRLYPPKEIIALATGVSSTNFSGGAEANGYLRKHGFQIEALRLPTEGDVQAALHDLLVTRAPSPVEPSDAYQTLADQFGLPERLRTKVMGKFQREPLAKSRAVRTAQIGRRQHHRSVGTRSLATCLAAAP